MTTFIPASVREQSGVLSMFGAATIWGTWVLIISAVTLPGIYILPVTFTSSAIALTVFALVSHRFDALMQILRNRDFMRLVLWVGLFEITQSSLYFVSYSMAIQDGGSVVIPVIRSLAGIVTPVLATFSSNERFSKMYLFYGTLSSIGAILIFSRGGITAGEELSYLALVLVTASVLLRGWFYLQQRRVAQEMMIYQMDARLVLTVQMIVSSMMLLIVSLVYYLVTPTPDVVNPLNEIAFLAVLGLTHTGLASLLRLLAMKKITAQQSIIIMYFEPFLSVMLSIIFLGESVTIGFFIGAGLILFSAGATSLHASGGKQKVWG